MFFSFLPFLFHTAFNLSALNNNNILKPIPISYRKCFPFLNIINPLQKDYF